jgi:hypothetical protein
VVSPQLPPVPGYPVGTRPTFRAAEASDNP